MDNYDQKILQLLSSSGRMSWTQLGDAVALSASACQRRVESLIDKGVIDKFTINVNPSELGLEVKALVAVNVNRGDTKQAEAFRQSLVSHPRIQSAHMVSGAIDYMLEVYASDLEDLARFLDEELLKMQAVRDATSSIVLRTVKSHSAVF